MFYLFDVTYWDTISCEEAAERGFVHANDYGKAAMELVDAFGEDYIVSLNLKELEAEDIIYENEINEALN